MLKETAYDDSAHEGLSARELVNIEGAKRTKALSKETVLTQEDPEKNHKLEIQKQREQVKEKAKALLEDRFKTQKYPPTNDVLEVVREADQLGLLTRSSSGLIKSLYNKIIAEKPVDLTLQQKHDMIKTIASQSPQHMRADELTHNHGSKKIGSRTPVWAGPCGAS